MHNNLSIIRHRIYEYVYLVVLSGEDIACIRHR